MKVFHDALGVDTTIALQGDDLITASSQDVEPILEDAKERNRTGQFGTSEFRHAARIPENVVNIYCNTHGITFEQFIGDETHIRRVLADPDLADFRIWKGQV